MNTAYLILAHNTPEHLSRLISALRTDSAHFFVHVDRKARLSDFTAASSDRVHFTAKRVSVYWGDFRQVEAILVLTREALAHPANFDRFVLLSGADYPVRSAGYIERFFERNSDKEFINVVPMSDAMGKPMSRLTGYRLRPSTPRPIRAVQRLLLMARVLPTERDYRTSFGGLAPYGGSTWWALSRAACQYVSDFAIRNPGFVEFHKHTRNPDESFFQTVLGNSEFRPRIVRNLTYADWSGGGRSPANLTDRHLDFLASRPRFRDDDQYGPGEILFARKFTDDGDELVRELARRIRENDEVERAPDPGTDSLR